VLSGGFIRPAFAQRTPVHSSLEAKFALADGVCLGTIAEVGEPNPTESGTLYVQVVLDITQTFKGEKRKRYPVFIHHDRDGINIVREWSRKRVPLLGFIRHRRNAPTEAALPERTAHFLPINPREDDPPANLPEAGYFSMDFRFLRTPREILDAVQRYAKKAPKTARIHAYYYIPNLIGKQTSTGGDLLVPVVPQLETIARRMVLTPASFLPAEAEVPRVSHEEYLTLKARDEGRIRKLGVEALAHFKSRANIELLKRYLSDPFIEPEWEYEKDIYIVRKRAFETLQKWGVSVAEPQLRPSPEDSKTEDHRA
jgi:hypothetical protein